MEHHRIVVFAMIYLAGSRGAIKKIRHLEKTGDKP
jgi:hypothetical protein